LRRRPSPVRPGLGISGGATPDEIDIGEMFNIRYGVGETIDTIRVVFLFNGPQFNDVAEITRVTVNGGASYTLSVSGSTTSRAGVAPAVRSSPAAPPPRPGRAVSTSSIRSAARW
jgi:ethanolamine utilization protein EutA (predicted chaperonin)